GRIVIGTGVDGVVVGIVAGGNDVAQIRPSRRGQRVHGDDADARPFGAEGAGRLGIEQVELAVVLPVPHVGSPVILVDRRSGDGRPLAPVDLVLGILDVDPGGFSG